MDKWLTTVLVKEIKGGKWQFAPIDILMLIGMTVCGIMLRMTVAGSYPVLETYGAYVSTKAGIQIVCYVFDFAIAALLAIAVFGLTKHKIKGFLAYGITFVLPVLVSASAMWALGDSIYLFFALLSFVLFLNEKNNVAVLIYGVSVFLNPYALFLLPLYVLAYLQGKIKLVSFLTPVAGAVLHYMLANANGFILFDAESALLKQRESKLLSYNCPNIFYIIGPDKFVNEYEKVALLFAIGFTAVLVLVLLTKKLGANITEKLEIALFFSLFLPFFLPGMNERSLVLACLISLVYGFVKLHRFWLPIVITIIAYISYSAFFRGESAVPLTGVAFVLLFLIAYLVGQFVKQESAKN